MPEITRRTFWTKIAKSLTITAGAIAAWNSAEAQVVWTHDQWNTSGFQQLIDAKGDVKQLFDITAIHGSLDKVKNSLNGLQVGFAIPPGEIRTVAGLHGPANLLNLDDYIWNKYKLGAWLDIVDPLTGKPAVRNPAYKSPFPSGNLAGDPSDLKSSWHDASMEGLQRRGVRFIGCHTALEFQVRELLKQQSSQAAPETVVREMLQHLQPGVLMVAAMVSAMALLQGKGRYSYVKI